jgi:hypothetical protein
MIGAEKVASTEQRNVNCPLLRFPLSLLFYISDSINYTNVYFPIFTIFFHRKISKQGWKHDSSAYLASLSSRSGITKK